MQESHGKGPASPPDPESCVDGRKAGGEALTGAHAGQPSSCEIIQSGVPTPMSEAEGHTVIGATGKPAASGLKRLTWGLAVVVSRACRPLKRPAITACLRVPSSRTLAWWPSATSSAMTLYL